MATEFKFFFSFFFLKTNRCMCDECGQTTEPEVYFELSVILCISGRPEWKVIVKVSQ